MHGTLFQQAIDRHLATGNLKLTTNITKLRVPLMAAALALMTVAIYWQVHHFDIVNYDDPQYLFQNPYVRRGITVAGVENAFSRSRYASFTPLLQISFELDHQLFGYSPRSMHLENVLLHLIGGMLVWRLFFVATGELNFSFVVAALFLCHPMHVESVAWITERKDVLSTPLLLLAILAYVRFCRTAPGHRRWFYLGTVVFFSLSLMVKAMGVTLPAILLLLDFWPLRRWPGKSWWSLVLEKIPLLLPAIVSSKLQYLAQSHAEISLRLLSLDDRVSNAIVCYVIYIMKLAAPTNLAAFYQHPGSRPMPDVLASAAVLVLISTLCWRLCRRWPFALVGWLWFLGTLIPVINLVQVGSQAMADRYSYLPSIGLFFAIVWGFAALVRNTKIRTAAALLAIAGYSVMAHRQVSYWRNTEILFTHAAAVTDDNPVAHVELAKLAYGRHDLPRAIDECNRAMKYRDDADAYCGLGMCWLMDNPEKAIGYFRRAAGIKPWDPDLKIQLAKALVSHGELDEALQLSREAVALNPEIPDYQAEVDLILAEMARRKPLRKTQ